MKQTYKQLHSMVARNKGIPMVSRDIENQMDRTLLIHTMVTITVGVAYGIVIGWQLKILWDII